MEKPLLLVDVDGVLNVFGSYWLDDEDPDFELEKSFQAQGYTIRFPIGLSERMAKLNEVFDCVWATTWEEKAQTDIASELGVGQEWPVINFRGWAKNPTWKLPDVKEWVDENAKGRRVAWIDDDLHSDAQAWAYSRRMEAPTLLVETHYEKGLTERQTIELLEWANDTGGDRA